MPTTEGWLYGALLVDAWLRAVVGWTMADSLRAELGLGALRMARGRRQPQGTALTHHPDRGCQYTAGAYQAVLASHGIWVSMSRTANWYDSALAERCFTTFNAELIDCKVWTTRAAAGRAMFEWIEGFSNRLRRHSALVYPTPAAVEPQGAPTG